MGRQVARQLGPPRHRRLVGGLAELYLEPLALADADHLPEPEAMARAGDRLALRVMNLGLEHHLDDDSGHGWQRSARRPGREGEGGRAAETRAGGRRWRGH